jgi:hypothetical protein
MKDIYRLIKANQKHGNIGDLIKVHGLDRICNTAHILLTDQLFESTLKAKSRFPGVFDALPALSAKTEASGTKASGAKAVKNEVNTIENVVQVSQEGVRDAVGCETAVKTESG